MSPRPLSSFQPAVRDWFAQTFDTPTRAQKLAWPAIARGESTLVLAPTGSGKTLAAFLAAIDRLLFAPVPHKAQRCRVLYVSPLKALAVDVERNLRAPIQGIGAFAAERGESAHLPEVAIRTGDTPTNERARMHRRPPDILITTPESLFLILTSRAREILSAVETLILDEIHVLVGTKRGAHLALSLERLEELAGRRVQRIGLSATQRPLDEVARYLGGGSGRRTWTPRPVTLVDAGAKKAFDLRVEVPVEDMSRPGETTHSAQSETQDEATRVRARHSIWPAMHPRLLDLVKGHRSTIVFVNSRRLAERLAAALNELAGEPIARAHHGSIAREQRAEIENALKAGRLPALVATSSLELGIDMGAVDLVIQIETPTSVASGMQRIGRASHQVQAVSQGVIFPKFRGDLLASAAITTAMKGAAVEPTRVPKNPLDVLAQQVVALVALEARAVDELFHLVRRAAPFRALPRKQFEGVLDMLSGRYPSDEFSQLRPRVVWDRLKGTVRAREGAQRIVVANAGTIPDRGLYGVFLAEGEGGGRRVGELDEEMVFESRVGEVFVLGASSWRIAEITRDRVLVLPAPGQPGKMPFWRADRGARPVELGRAIGRLTRDLAARPRQEALERLEDLHDLEPQAAQNLMTYLDEQREATGVLPDDRTIVLERTRDEVGDWRLCLLGPWGGRVHAPWAMALEAKLRLSGQTEVETLWSDDGIVVRVPERERPPDAADLLPEPEDIEDLVVGELGRTSLFAAHFREAAGRALLLPRRRPGQRTPLWMQRKKAHDLLQVVSRYPAFPIVLEAYRECLQDVFDLEGLVTLAGRVRRRDLRLVTVDTQAPSPFSASLLFGYVANYLYDDDAPLAERRAQALSVDQAQLRELLGAAELRELIDRDALAELELVLQGVHARRVGGGGDELHDLLLRLGDLSLEEIATRTLLVPGEDGVATARARTDALIQEGRAIEVQIAGERRLAAAEDAGRLRDATGALLPQGLPAAFVEPFPHAVRELVARYARTHGPFETREVVGRYGLPGEVVLEALAELRNEGRVLEGEFRPGGTEREWCGAEVLAALRRRSLAALRKQVEPAEPEALVRLLLAWQGVGGEAPGRPVGDRSGPDALLDVLEQLQGSVFPASILERSVLPARLCQYRPGDLDTLAAAGEIVWVGRGPLGERDGRLALFLTDSLPLLSPLGGRVQGTVHDRLREYLAGNGASYFGQLLDAAGGGLARPVQDALWDLAWAGEVTNDAPEALRAFLATHSARSERHSRVSAFRSRRQVPPAVVGRWSLLSPSPSPPTPTHRMKALAEQLLERHGVLTRDGVAHEDVPGGFSAIYPILRALEEAGKIRRGYFVAGRGGLQFALPGALDRLRAPAGTETEAATVVLASADPANPYGAALPWPRVSGLRLQRAAGSYVVLAQGHLGAYVSRNGKEVFPLLPAEEPLRSRVARGVARALAGWVHGSGRPTLGWSADPGASLAEGPLAPHLAEVGFVRSGPGFRFSGTTANESGEDRPGEG